MPEPHSFGTPLLLPSAVVWGIFDETSQRLEVLTDGPGGGRDLCSFAICGYDGRELFKDVLYMNGEDCAKSSFSVSV